MDVLPFKFWTVLTIGLEFCLNPLNSCPMCIFFPSLFIPRMTQHDAHFLASYFGDPVLAPFFDIVSYCDPLEENEVQREVMFCMPIPGCWGCPDTALAEMRSKMRSLSLGRNGE